MEKTNVVIVTNIPAPYRIPVFELLSTAPSIQLTVIYCSDIEPDRAWQFTDFKFNSVFLRKRFIAIKDRFIHINPDVWSVLRKIKPDIVIR